MIDLRDLKAFYWVVKLGGFRRAADKLNTTQPAISARIRNIETSLGVLLLTRDPRLPAMPTGRGHDLFRYAEQILALHGEMMAAVTAADAERDRLRLGVAETIVQLWLPQFMRRVYAQHPDIDIEISVGLSNDLQERMLHGQLDLAFLLGPSPSALLHSRPLRNYPLAFVCAPSLPIPAETLDCECLSHWRILSFSRATLPYQQIRQCFLDSGVPRVRMSGSDSLASIIQMAVDGLGIGVVPLASIRRELASGQLRVIDTTFELPHLAFVAAYVAAADNALSRSVCELASDVAAAFPPDE
jgi:DNA-binding transcriptional LysR family regulator